MKKLFLTICLAVTAVLALQAESFTGNIVVNRNGQTNNANVTVNVTQQTNGLYTLVLQVPTFGTMTMTDVHSAYRRGFTVYSAEREVATNFGTMRTILFARTIDGMMTADVAIPAQNTTMRFNTVGDPAHRLTLPVLAPVLTFVLVQQATVQSLPLAHSLVSLPMAP